MTLHRKGIGSPSVGKTMPEGAVFRKMFGGIKNAFAKQNRNNAKTQSLDVYETIQSVNTDEDVVYECIGNDDETSTSIGSFKETPTIKCGNDSEYTSLFQTGEKWKKIDEVPTDVSQLSVGEVADCLRLLKLDVYVDKFVARDVDGALVADMSEKMMKKSFKMNDLDAKKLFKFVGGWRPKI